jgi:membrane protein DedA with SNARE-associated domain
LQDLLAQHGYGVVFGVVFLNNLGFPVPGDMMLLGAGLLAEKGTISLGAIVASGTAACFMGGNGAYGLGIWIGPHFSKKFLWFRFKSKRIERLEGFFKRHGAKAVFFARLVALLHPITGLLAGMGKMPWRPFLFFNLVGSAAYSLIYALTGYFFGSRWSVLKIWMGHIGLYALFFMIAMALLFLSLLLWNFFYAFFARVYSK